MNIRIATPSDLAAVHAIYSDPRIARWLGREPMPIDEFQPLYNDLCARPSLHVWELDGGVAGFHHLSRLRARTGVSAYLSTVALEPTHQGRGLAQQVLGAMIGQLRSEGVDRIDLIVDSDNTRAVASYQRLGFVIERTLSRCAQRDGAMTMLSDHYMGMSL